MKKHSLFIKYNNKTNKISTSSFLQLQFKSLLGFRSIDFKYEIGERLIDEHRDITILEREYRYSTKNPDKKGRVFTTKEKWYKFKCNKCEFEGGKHYDIKNKEFKDEYWVVEYGISGGGGCNCCRFSPRIIVEGTNDVLTTAPWLVEIMGMNVEDARINTKCSSNKVAFKCNNCGNIEYKKISDVYTYKSAGCKVCGDGIKYPEKFTHNVLIQSNVDFESQVRYEWCKYYNPYKKKNTFGIYDFVIESQKIIIEADGGFHRNDNNMNGQTKEESEFIDNMKDMLAYNNGYKVIRISDEISLKYEILLKLPNYIDVSKIDFEKADKFAITSNMVKEICNYWNNKSENEFASDLVKVFKYHRSTIIRYLKRGVKLGWCEYDEVTEELRGSQKSRELCSKPVEMYNRNGEFLGEFKSSVHLQNESEKLFGIKLLDSRINSCCNKIRNHHKGYFFKFKNDDRPINFDVKITKMNNKIEVFKDNISLGIYDSSCEIDRISEEKFGIKLDFSPILKVCKGKQKHHKGFIFKFV